MKLLLPLLIVFLTACSSYDGSQSTESEYLLLQKKEQQVEQKKFVSPTSVPKERSPLDFGKYEKR